MTIIDRVPAGSEQHWDPAPGVDIVMPLPEGVGENILDGRTLKLVGALHRRFWARRRDLLQRRAQQQPQLADTVVTGTEETCWSERIEKHQALSIAIADGLDEGAESVVVVRGWESTEPGVLVDGRAVPGCIFDLAVAMSAGADAFRRDEQPFAVVIPQPESDEEALLWRDLTQLAHDRAGIDRGTVQVSPR